MAVSSVSSQPPPPAPSPKGTSPAERRDQEVNNQKIRAKEEQVARIERQNAETGTRVNIAV